MKFHRSLIAVLIFCGASSARAGLILDIAFDDGTKSKSLATGGTFFVDLFIIDTDASTPLTANGLASGGGRIFKSSGAANVMDLDSTIAGTVPGTAWGNLTSPVAGVAANTISSALVAAPVGFPPTPVGIGETNIHIARFGMQIFGSEGDAAVLHADVLGSLIGNLTAFVPPATPGTDLDAILTDSGTFGSVNLSVNAVPEASSVSMLALLSIAAMGVRKRRNRRTDYRSNLGIGGGAGSEVEV